ncbi:MAG: hypothetical protein J6L88_06280 [Clostridia bacterium]|nr:hypothetical protein [Clostridia bacterium]
MALIGLDVGGSGAKAVAFSDEGKILCTSYQEYDMINPAPGQYEYDPNAIWAAARGVLAEAAQKCGDIVRGIGVSSFGESYAILDENDQVLCNTMMYLDTRGQEFLDELNAKYDIYDFRAKMGSRPRINHSTVKLHVVSAERPDVIKKAKKILFMMDFVLYRLGGEHATDYSLAETTGGLDLTTYQWNRELFDWAGIDVSLLPKLVAPGTCVGTLSEKAAADLGIAPGAKLVCGGLDHIPASIGCGVTKKGQLANSIGTVDCFNLITDTIDPHIYDGDFLFLPHYTKDHFGGLIANMAGGVLLKWFRNHIGKYEKEMWKNEGKNFYVEYEKRMAKEPTDLIVLPRFAGYSKKFSDRAGILNMTLSTTNEELYRAFMEGASYEMFHMMQAYGQGIDSVTAVGGGANCDTYMQIRADVFNLPVYTVTCDQTGALGNAMAAGIAAGIFRDVDEAVAACVETRKVFYPDQKRNEYYMEMYDKYLRIYKALEEF